MKTARRRNLINLRVTAIAVKGVSKHPTKHNHQRNGSNE